MQYIILKSITAFEGIQGRRMFAEKQYSVDHPPGELARNNTEVLGAMLNENRDKLPEGTYQKCKAT